ncbi:hypothetical protein [Vibrio sp. SCSIO 43135]|uniref:hypothetical protein n=1 Tax=Vibrio sp. SCSIO 43135 TaxID=2819096 RepID=UPI0033654F88
MMRTGKWIAFVLFCGAFLTACANEAPLGSHVVQLRSEQIYNLDATRDNVAIVPTGNGERMEGAYHLYTGRKSDGLKGSESQVLESFAD